MGNLLPLEKVLINVISSGHQALDHRIFDKECKSLLSAGATVNLIAFHPQEEIIDGIHIIPIPKWKSRFERFLFAPWYCLSVGLKHKSNVWHFHDAELLQICPLLCLIRPNVIILYDRHEDFPWLVSRRDWLPLGVRRIAKTILNLLERGLAKYVDGIITVSKYLSISFINKPTIYLYNFPSKHFAQLASEYYIEPSRRIYDVIHLGVLSAERLIFLCVVLREMIELKDDLRLLVIGVSKDQKIYLEGNFLQKNLTVITNIPYNEVPRWLVQVKVGINIHPVLYPHLMGALPVKVIEYMSAGCSVVSSKLPELSVVISSQMELGVQLIDSQQPEEYGHAVLELLHDTQSLDRNARKNVRYVDANLIWESQEEKLVGFYQSLLERRKG